jgi:hypothetical protein
VGLPDVPRLAAFQDTLWIMLAVLGTDALAALALKAHQTAGLLIAHPSTPLLAPRPIPQPHTFVVRLAGLHAALPDGEPERIDLGPNGRLWPRRQPLSRMQGDSIATAAYTSR